MQLNKRLLEIYGDTLAGELGDDRTKLPSSIPIIPVDQMATQLSQEKPPIEDKEYIPATREELSLAVKEIAMLVPDEQVEMFYRSTKDLLEQARDIQNNPKLNSMLPKDPEDFKKPIKAKKAKNIKKESKNIIQKCVKPRLVSYIVSTNNHKGDLMKESNPAMPISKDRKSQVAFGGKRQS